MKAIIKLGLGLLGLATVLVATTAGVMRAHAVSTKADVIVASENRVVESNIVNVVVSGPIDLNLKQSSVATLVVKGASTMIPRVTSRIEANTLFLGTRGIIVTINQPLIVELGLPGLKKLQLQGSGDSLARGFRGDYLDLQTSGSGNLDLGGEYQHIKAISAGSGNLTLNFPHVETIELGLQGSGDTVIKGQTRAFSAKLTGSGNLDASTFKAGQLTLQSLGSGDVKVFAKEDIKLNLLGSGDAIIYGTPARKSIEHSGSGNVRWE
jgi:hypothetical protein